MLRDEHVIDLSQATKLFPNRPHASTIWRWSRRGLGGVRLEYIRAGRKILTSVEAVERFCRALADADDVPPAPQQPRRTSRARSPQQKQRDVEKARATLQKTGFTG